MLLVRDTPQIYGYRKDESKKLEKVPSKQYQKGDSYSNIRQNKL